MAKGVFTSKVVPSYDDLPEERYHFPKTYLNQVKETVGDWILYYEPRRLGKGLSGTGGRQSYIAIAQVDRIEEDLKLRDHYYAFVSNYIEFDTPVPFKMKHGYLEQALVKNDGTTNKGAFGRSVRLLPDHEYHQIVSMGFGKDYDLNGGSDLAEVRDETEDFDRLKVEKLVLRKTMQKYSVNQYSVESVINWVKSGEIAIPEIQRPFVWSSTKVRDLMDSLYQGYPVGYIISWRNPDVKLKDGSLSMGKKVLIDGQQRVTALTTSLVGQSVIDSNYNTVVIRIAFHPMEERFEVLNSAIKKNKEWIREISEIIRPDFSTLQFIRRYLEKNPEADESVIERNIQRLKSIVQRPVGMIELNHDLDIETVTEIFIRINSKGVVLSQADFAMSKIAANETYGGNTLRKAIDYFCHLAVAPEFYSHIFENDKDFVDTEYFRKMKWLKNENDDLYDPDYNDMLRVAFCYKFKRGKLSDLVSLLSGRNFETRSYEESIAEVSFKKLADAVSTFMNETLFKRFVMIIKSAGFVDSKLIRSQNAMNFAYVLFLHLREIKLEDALIERFVRRWFVMSILLGRYSASPESHFDSDIRSINELGIEKALGDIETAYLSDSFWESGLPQRLATSSSNAPALHVFWAAQSKLNDKGFLSRDITVKEMIEHRGDIHHIFPKKYLKESGFTRSQYNQVANYVYVQQEINIKVGKRSPAEYIGQIRRQCDDGKLVYGGIDTLSDFEENLSANCIPVDIHQMDVSRYQEFLAERRALMARKIKVYYQGL